MKRPQHPNTKTSPVFGGNIKFMILVEANMFPIITNPVQFKLSSKLKKNTEEAEKMHFHFLTDTLNDFLLYLKGKTFYQAGATELLFFYQNF